jgi:hypothetical protein
MKCSQPDYVHKYKIRDMVTCGVCKEGTTVEQRNAVGVMIHEEEVVKGE